MTQRRPVQVVLERIEHLHTHIRQIEERIGSLMASLEDLQNELAEHKANSEARDATQLQVLADIAALIEALRQQITDLEGQLDGQKVQELVDTVNDLDAKVADSKADLEAADPGPQSPPSP